MKKPFKPNQKPPMTQPDEVAAAEAVEAEVLPQDGLTVLSEDEAKVLAEKNDPPLSVPVDEVVKQPAPIPVEGAMHYLGTTAMDGMLGKGGARRPSSYPVVVTAADGRIVGIVVVGDPGDVGQSLAASLEAAGHAGAPFTLSPAMSLARSAKLAAAKSIAAQQDPTLDRVGALMALGYTPESLA